MAGFQRPEGGWRAHFQGIKTNSPADAMQPTKSPYSQNIRAVNDQTVTTRPGYTQLFSAAAGVTDIRAYASLNTDNLPRYLARNTANKIYLDNGLQVASLAGTSLGAFMIPFRPNNSPQSWMYVGVQSDYQKLSAPDPVSNAVTAYKVGIAEQQNPPDVCPESFAIYEFTNLAAQWTQGGNAGAAADGTRLAASTIGAIFADPASGSDLRYSFEVLDTDSYQVGMLVVLDAADTNLHCVVQDILPPINDGTTLVIGSIYYYAGTTGRCVISASQFPANATAPMFSNNNPTASSIYSDSVIASLRRSAIVSITNGEAQTDKLFVLSTTTGPDGLICFEVSTTHNFDAGDVITGLGAIVVTGANGVLANDPIVAADITGTLTGAGTGTYKQALGTNPFEQLLNPTNAIAQQDDYIAIGVNIDDLSRFVIGKLTFNVGTTVDYLTDAFYIQFTANDLVFHPPAETQVTQTIPSPTDTSLDGNVQPPPEVITTTVPLPSNQWTTLFFPVRSLVRLGNDLTKTLSDCNGVQISFQCTATINIAFAGLVVGGGGHPDVGTNPPYFYIVRGRNIETGALSNPSPCTRYSVSPRRQPVLLTMADSTSDPQIDTWDVFRFGGTVQSWRYIGSTPSTGGTDHFTDDFFDTAALAGDVLDYDNFEPWPTIDIPFNIVTGTVGGVTTAIMVTGTTVLVTWSSAAVFTNPAPSTILRWLPGTLLALGGQTAYTLWDRPTAVVLASPPAAHYFAYLFQLVENAGNPTPTTLSIIEPNVANQHLPYLGGPDANGTVFGCGDPLRPGSFYYAKNNNPDSAPDTNNQELTPPSEPLLGIEVINGVTWIASSNRWWKLYLNYQQAIAGGAVIQRYQAVEMPVGRGLVAPYAHCNDGKVVYFVAKDGIYMTAGGEGISLTNRDLYNLFPREDTDTPQNYSYGGFTITAPDYRYVGEFRLAYCNGYLYFDYRDSTNTPRTLTCDLRDPTNPAWVLDVYHDPITRHYMVEQQESTVLTTTTRYPLLIMADSAGKVYQGALNANDNGIRIDGVYATFEYNGGDLRADQLFNDAFIDLIPVSGATLTPLTDGVAQAAATAIGASNTRLQTNVPIGKELKYMGVMLIWSDDFNAQTQPTSIEAWQPMYQGVPVSVFQWKTQGTSFGWKSYGHLRQWNFAYRSTAQVTITITAQDGTSPAPITLPSTNGAVVKTMFPFTFNKGMLYFFVGVSTAQWTPYLSESELFTGEWGRTSPYALQHDIEAPVGIRS